MEGAIKKGIVGGIDGRTARIIPHGNGAVPPKHMIIPSGVAVSIGAEVAYAVFADNTGVVLARTDGGA